MVAAANALHGGRGFALGEAGGDATYELSRVTRYYRFNYTVRTYTFGLWDTVG